jgi:hypothetical protein
MDKREDVISVADIEIRAGNQLARRQLYTVKTTIIL